MEKSTLVKVVWLGAILAIPAAVWVVQRPEAPKVEATARRIVALDQPFAVDISGQQIEGARPAEAVGSVEAPKPLAVRLGTEKITLKGGAAPSEPAAKMDGLAPRGPNLASVLTVAGPLKTATP